MLTVKRYVTVIAGLTDTDRCTAMYVRTPSCYEIAVIIEIRQPHLLWRSGHCLRASRVLSRQLRGGHVRWRTVRAFF